MCLDKSEVKSLMPMQHRSPRSLTAECSVLLRFVTRAVVLVCVQALSHAVVVLVTCSLRHTGLVPAAVL